jgi:hypothetical protein
MTLEGVEINAVSRRMRGGSQAYMVRASDGHTYVAKFTGNPQGTRTLINEWIGNWFFKRFGIATPEIRVLRLSQKMIDRTDLHFQMGSRKVHVRPGLHFGSRCPVNPDKKTIFDFLPSPCLQRVGNLDDFAKALVLDRVLGQTDSRQCIFFRQSSAGRANVTFTASLIDHGWIFGGNQWVFNDSPQPRRSLHWEVYPLIDTVSVCQRAINSLLEISERELQAVTDEIPCEWFTGNDHNALRNLLNEVVKRTSRLESLFWPYLSAVMSCVNGGRLIPSVTAESLSTLQTCRVL